MKKHDFHDDCCLHKCEPPKRERPPYCGKVDTAGMGEYYSAHAPHHCHPHCGYDIPPLKPLFVPGMSPQEQIQLIAGRVDEMIHTLNEYNCKVWGAYDEIVHSAICNDAYYSEIVTETGYLSETSAKYTVVHIPFIDRAGEPIYMQLGLAYDNTTNSGLKESVFDASERKIADKLIPAFNVTDKWNGKGRWCGAPIQSTEGKFTLGVSKNGFLKIYNNSATDADMNKDEIFYAMGVQGVLVSGGAKTADSYDEATKDKLIGRVGIGMNYDTQERFFILVDGYGATGVEDGGGCTSSQLAELFVKYGCTVAVEVANGNSNCMLDKGELVNIPYDTGVTRTSSNTEGGKIPYVPKVNCFWYITKKRHYHNDYVREVGELMQKYGRSIWQGIIDEKAVNALKDEVQNVYKELDKEINDRKEADGVLQTSIDNLDNRVTELYNVLVEKVTELDGKISKLREDLTTETSERKEADNALQAGIGEAKSLIEHEATERQKGDEANKQLIDKEIADRKTADSEMDTALKALINAESEARVAGDETNKQLIDKEIADRKTADSEMDKALKALINAETEARTAGDEKLANQIANVISNLNSFKTKTESDIEEINSDLDTLTASINALSNTVTNNKIDIETKVTNLTARVTANETTTNDNVDKIAKINSQINAMQTTISALNETVTALQSSFASTEQSFENVKQTVASMQTELNTFEQTVNTKLKELSDKFGEYLPLTGSNVDMETEIPQYPITGPVVFDTIGEGGSHNILLISGAQLVFADDGTHSYGMLDRGALTLRTQTGNLGSDIKLRDSALELRSTVDNSVIGFGLEAEVRDDKTVLRHWCNKDTHIQTINKDTAILANIGDGTDDNDAVNVKQLNTVKKELSDKFGEYLPLTGSNVTMPEGGGFTAQFPITGPVLVDTVVGEDGSHAKMLIDGGQLVSLANGENGPLISINEAQIFVGNQTKNHLGDEIKLMNSSLELRSTVDNSVIGFGLEAELRDDKTVLRHWCNKDTNINTVNQHEAVLANIGDGTDDNDAVNVKQLKKAKSELLPLSGGTMAGDIDMSQQAIKNAYEIGVTDAGETHDVKFHVNDDGSLTVGAYNHGATSGKNARVQIAEGTDDHDAVSLLQLANIVSTYEVPVHIDDITIKANTTNTYAPVLLLRGTFSLLDEDSMEYFINVVAPSIHDNLDLFVTVNPINGTAKYRYALYAINAGSTDLNISARTISLICHFKTKYRSGGDM